MYKTTANKSHDCARTEHLFSTYYGKTTSRSQRVVIGNGHLTIIRVTHLYKIMVFTVSDVYGQAYNS